MIVKDVGSDVGSSQKGNASNIENALATLRNMLVTLNTPTVKELDKLLPGLGKIFYQGCDCCVSLFDANRASFKVHRFSYFLMFLLLKSGRGGLGLELRSSFCHIVVL